MLVLLCLVPHCTCTAHRLSPRALHLHHTALAPHTASRHFFDKVFDVMSSLPSPSPPNSSPARTWWAEVVCCSYYWLAKSSYAPTATPYSMQRDQIQEQLASSCIVIGDIITPNPEVLWPEATMPTELRRS